MLLKNLLVIVIIFLSIPIAFAELTIWHVPKNPETNDTVNIYANISFNCFNEISAKFRVNSGEWQTIWNGGWIDPKCQTNVTNFLITHNLTNYGKSLGPFNGGDKVEYSVEVGEDGKILATSSDNFVITKSQENPSNHNLYWIIPLIIFLVILLFVGRKLVGSFSRMKSSKKEPLEFYSQVI
jgi:hypothetical protein